MRDAGYEMRGVRPETLLIALALALALGIGISLGIGIGIGIAIAVDHRRSMPDHRAIATPGNAYGHAGS
jgi:hypothetical protein